jgi:pyruvate dehydrogenase E2 component (dihydrolipoamide acetyltransferase)
VPDFRLPDLGEGLEQAEIVTWRVQVGDRVEVDQIVVEVETAKAAVEVPIPFAGVVSAMHAEAGTALAVGAPLISVTEVAGFAEPGVVTPAGDSESGSGNVLIGYGTSAPARRTRRGARRRPLTVATAAVPPAADHRTGPVPVISPLVRKLAREGGLDLDRTVGTGPAGVVTRTDVDRALHAAATSDFDPATVHNRDDLAQLRGQSRGGGERGGGERGGGERGGGERGGETRVPIRGLRKTVADKLSRSRREIPEATVWVDVDATELLATRTLLNERRPEQPVGLLALLARFTVLALRRYPELNARIEGDEIVLSDAIHLGFAAQTERGLVVPVVRDADRLASRELSAALAAHTTAARDGRLSPADLTGGTFTVNNYGVFGVDGSAAIINHPEVAILGLGRIIDRPWVVDGQLTVRKVSELTLAFDHRVCDGGTAGGFLRYIADCVEAPVLALGEA